MQKKILLALALLCAAPPARADSFTTTPNITAGSTPFSGTAGLLLGGTGGASGVVNSLAATITPSASLGLGTPGRVFTASELGQNQALIATQLAPNNNVQLVLTKDGGFVGGYQDTIGSSNLALVNLSPTYGGWGYAFEIYYTKSDGNLVIGTYIGTVGNYASRAWLTVSGATHAGSGTGGDYGNAYLVLQPNNYVPSMIQCWADVIGPCIDARTQGSSAGALAFAGEDYNGVYTIGLDSNNKQLIFGATTISSTGGIFTGDTFIARAGAANVQFGGADAASPVGQTISFQNVLAGTSNTAGVDTYILASASTGNAKGGVFHFKTAVGGSSGTTQNALSDQLVIDPVLGVIATGNLTVSNFVFTSAGYNFSNGSSIRSPVSGAFEFLNNGGSSVFGLSTVSNGVAALGNGTSADYSGTLKLASLLATGGPATATTGQIAYGGTTAAASNCGSLSGAAGCIVENVAGTTRYTPYY